MVVIVVGSVNPNKVGAIMEIWDSFVGDTKVIIQGVKVPSDISEMPFSRDETITGARNRAANALKEIPDADFGVGIEGGLEYSEQTGYILRAWCVIIRKSDHREFLGSSTGMWLPESLITYMKVNNVDLSRAIEIILGLSDIGKKDGIYGLFTGGKVTRKHAFIDALQMALWPLQYPEYFQKLIHLP